MPLSDVLESLRQDPDLAGGFTAWRVLSEAPASYAEFPAAIDPRLIAALRQRGIERLYTHQAQASQPRCSPGENVVVVTPTASGKTLCYNLPVLQAILERPRRARALPLPDEGARAGPDAGAARASSRELGADIKTFTYDGDTPGDARRKVREAGHIVVTNPDMLHTGILPHHTKWVKLFENLRYVVIDELHQYRGVFGSHVANVLRRLRRICRFYGSDPDLHLLLGDDRQPARARRSASSARP